jgi:ferritin-like metal-binding protein YciE
MAEKTLQTLFHDTLRDIYYAERKILKSLPKMARAAQSPELKAAFEKHREQTEGQIERLQQVFEIIGKPARGKTCDAIEGILAEGDEITEEYKDTAALDAGLLAAAQAVEHYEITRYGTLKRWAQVMGLKDAVKLLDETLQEESQTDEDLTAIADSPVSPPPRGRRGRTASDRQLLQSEVGRIELGRIGQSLPGEDADVGPAPFQPPRLSHDFQRAVHMHRRHAQKVGDLRLDDRKTKGSVASESDGFQAGVDFTDQQGGPLQRLLPPQRQEPFAMHGGVHHRLQPQQTRQVRVLLRQASQTVVGSLCDEAIGQGAHPVIDPLQHEAVQVDEISGKVDLGVLTPPVAQVAVARAEPADNQAGVIDQGVL